MPTVSTPTIHDTTVIWDTVVGPRYIPVKLRVLDRLKQLGLIKGYWQPEPPEHLKDFPDYGRFIRHIEVPTYVPTIAKVERALQSAKIPYRKVHRPN